LLGSVLSVVVGIGTSSGATIAEVAALVDETLAIVGLGRDAVVAVATIATKTDEPAVATLGWPVKGYGPDELRAVDVPRPSDTVMAATGTPSVAEAAALLAAGTGAELVVAKRASAHATVAVARGSPQ
jgi:cobalamin biosynthesis protein CbiG